MTTLNAWPKLRVSRRTSTAASSAVPKTPSLPARSSETPLVDSLTVSSGSSNAMSIERTKKTRAPWARFTAVTVGAKVSGTTSSTTTLDSAALPPVSVARTCTVSELPPLAMVGACVNNSNGNETSLDTTTPLTSNSMLRTCTSSVIVGSTRTVRPSSTCTPGAPGLASTPSTAIDTTGARPALSSEM